MKRESVSNEKDVQRLGIDSSYQLPKVLRDVIHHDTDLLNQRQRIIQNEKIRGNTKEAKEYKQNLPAQLPTPILSWTIGLILSDATVELTGTQMQPSARLKIQQTYLSIAFLKATMEILLPWVLRITQPNVKDRPKMWEITTLSHPAILQAGLIFAGLAPTQGSSKFIKKQIPDNIQDYLDPIAISAWFCGDGGRRDYGKNEGKAIQFHTQGFSKTCCDKLATALNRRYGWNTRVVLDYTKAEREFFYIQIEASSFNSFESILKPYILPEFYRRLPKTRSSQSRFQNFF